MSRIESRFDPAVLDVIVRENLPGCDLPLEFRPVPTGKYNTSFFVRGWKRPLVLRIAPPANRDQNLFYEFLMMRQEPGIHALVRERTVAPGVGIAEAGAAGLAPASLVPVPEIIAHRTADSTLGRDWVLMERLPGAPISEVPLERAETENVLREVGRALAQVHSITREEYGYVGPHQPMEPREDWTHAFHLMWNLLLDDIVGCSGYTLAEADGMRRLLDRRMKAFARPVKASLLHMDIWAENILCTEDGRLTGLLDWDRGLWGDPEIEFAVLDYCGISEPAFWEGYGRERDSSPEAEIRRIFYLLYEVQKYIFIRRVRGGNPSGADSYRRQCLALAAQLG